MAPQKYSAQVMNSRANGAVYPSSGVSSLKKPKMEQLQADHELFLQAFESKSAAVSFNTLSKPISFSYYHSIDTPRSGQSAVVCYCY